MSGLWKKINSFEHSHFEGIITLEKPFDFDINARVESEFNFVKSLGSSENSGKNFLSSLNSKIIHFIFNNNLNTSGNSYLIGLKFIENNMSSCLISDKQEVVGFALSIPNTLSVNQQDIPSSLTTYLTVSLEHRKSGLAGHLIRNLIDYGYCKSILTGYHFIAKPRNSTHIKCFSFYRPLNLTLAKENGYEIPESYDYDIFPSSDYTIRPSIYEDFENLNNKTKRKVCVNFTSKEFENLCKNVYCYTIFSRVSGSTETTGKIVGIFMYQHVMMHVKKLSKLCPIARLVYCEMLHKHRSHILPKIIHHLTQQKKYAVMAGVCLGELSDVKLCKRNALILSGETYLDFYNIWLEPQNCKAENINVLYI